MDNTLMIPRKTKSSFWQDIVLRLMTRMHQGRLDLELPNGEQLVIGNGIEPIRACIRIHDNAFFKHCILYGDIGLGEAYVEGLWDTDDIAAVISWVLLNLDKASGIPGNRTPALLVNLLNWWNRWKHIRRVDTPAGSRRNNAAHDHPNNDFFRLFLDPTMTYSAAYFRRDGMTLEQAQFAKYERLCSQLHLRATDHVLEIGSGWGGSAIYMARQYGCRITTLTISAEQYQLSTQRIKAAGLESRITVLLRDYRNFSGRFDKIVSVEMSEAVGHRYLDTYFKKCNEWLKRDGILAFQVITCPDSRYDSLRKSVDWIQKYISPGPLPSVAAINAAVNRSGEMTLVDLKDLGLHYAATLKVWFMQFNSRLTEVKALGFDNHFIRKWNYYLCYCEAAFRMRNIHVMQLVYTRPNNLSR
ncbi:MAG TPA: cyclopropane-fatty-acyl-phospholipid synthase family protein [Puia sp.]|nr:cyclopropane-fatty-acyl-phospholipid synthase family protein [Puia sp.]